MAALNIRDLAAGAIFIVIGALFVLGTRDLEFGTALKMGPGFFPLLLAIVLILLGLAIAATSFLVASEPFGAVSVRGVVLILLAPVVFGLTVRGLGLAPAIAIATLIASFASSRVSVPMALALTLGLTAFCVAVFHYGLGLPLRLIGPWLSF